MEHTTIPEINLLTGNRKQISRHWHPKVARLAPDMKSLAEKAKDLLLLDENGDPIQAGDHDKAFFFEAAWVHKHQDT